MARSSAASAAKLLAPPPAPDFRQERSRRSYEALLDAGTRLFGTAGYDGVGTPDIAAEAGVAVGTFYRYFVDKQAIYLEIARRSLAAAYADTIARLTPDRFVGRARHETIAETVAILFDRVLRNPALWASFVEMALRDPEVGALQRSYDELSCDRLTTLIAAISTRAVVPDPEATAHVLYVSTMHCAAGMTGRAGKSRVAADRVRAALATMIERALFPES